MLRQLAEGGIGHRREIGFGGQCAERCIQQLAERIRIDIADHGDLQRVPG